MDTICTCSHPAALHVDAPMDRSLIVTCRIEGCGCRYERPN